MFHEGTVAKRGPVLAPKWVRVSIFMLVVEVTFLVSRRYCGERLGSPQIELFHGGIALEINSFEHCFTIRDVLWVWSIDLSAAKRREDLRLSRSGPCCLRETLESLVLFTNNIF